MGHGLRVRLSGEFSGARDGLVRLALVGLLVTILTTGALASVARADGDPASDVLVSHRLFLPSDATGAPHRQQARLYALLGAADHAGFPIRVAVIASGYDLGSVTALWRRPRAYARFLGIELSLVHRGPLLVVMPDGFGFNWPGHSTAAAYRLLSRIQNGSAGAGLLTAAGAAVQTLAAANGSRIGPASHQATNPPGHRSGTDVVAIIAAAVAALAAAMALTFIIRVALRRHRRASPAVGSEPATAGRDGAQPAAGGESAAGGRRGFAVGRRWGVPGLAALCCVATGTPILVLSVLRHAPAASGSHVAASGSDVVASGGHVTAVATPYTWRVGQRRAPGFRLTGENGRPISLAAYRGRPVIVTFIDPLCRNLCPLAAHVLNQVDGDLPRSQRPVIIAVSVDIYADSRADLLQDFRRWHLVPQWHWAIGSPRQLAAVWKRYHVGVSVKTKTIAGTTVHFITHDEVAFVVDRSGYVRALYGWPYEPRNLEAELSLLRRS